MLKSTSPCIDKGIQSYKFSFPYLPQSFPNYDIRGNSLKSARTRGVYADMGAYEF